MAIKPEISGTKRGYLKEDFQFFHLKDRKSMEFDFHFHDFSKIIILISGKVTYYIEGTAYRLKPWDILLVSNREVHKPVIEQGELYDRIVLWMNPSFLEAHSSEDCNLQACFELASGYQSTKFLDVADKDEDSQSKTKESIENSRPEIGRFKASNLLRLDAEKLRKIRGLLLQLEETKKSSEFGSRLLGNSLFIQFMIYLNRSFLGGLNESNAIDMEFDDTVNSIIKYINENLNGDLAIETLAGKFYLSRYYLMHKFKSCTGYSLHNYVIQKRLIMANELIKMGKPATEAAMECGFNDYSSFMRAFKKMFSYSPSQHRKNKP